MKRDRNHEGYHDPTAGEAIRRVSEQQKRQKHGLTYTIGDVMRRLQIVVIVK